VSSFSKHIQFKFPWRKYQKRVLETLDLHMQDDHLHVIAPPGSGKTVLGLEVMLRIGKPTLILAPTLAIRNQWIHRFCALFLQEMDTPDWISKDINNPKIITVVTYQGLHSACNDQGANKLDFEDKTDIKTRAKSNFLRLEAIVKKLKHAGVETFVLDESHHLKNEWWQTLTRLKKAIKPKIVGLTATPPYDVSPLEWQRYIDLNGSIDVEISVPELMEEGDLCPHQDFVYFSKVTDVEHEKIAKYRNKVRLIYEELRRSPLLIHAIEEHPMLVNPLGQEFYIFENLDFYAASLIFLKDNEIPISAMHLQIMGVTEGKETVDLPKFEEKWLEIILYYFLFDTHAYFELNFADERKRLQDTLKHAGVLDRKSIRFSYNPTINKRISSSVTKLQSIEDIVHLEYQWLGNNLRQVILTDYLRKEYLLNEKQNTVELKVLGVVPIFEHLRRNNTKGIKLGVLTGTLVIIPCAAYAVLKELMMELNIKDLILDSLLYDASYLRCIVNDQNRDQMVFMITHLLQQGYIEVLIGTKALLGEGWDAPSINSLILASVVGAFVSSNQMRGRAIRTSMQDVNKTSNIWHLACVDPSVPDGGVDVDIITRRFRNFVGISEETDLKIQNGIDRLGLYDTTFDSTKIIDYNRLTKERASKRYSLKERWNQALPKGTELVEEIKIPYFEPTELSALKTAQLQKSITNMVATLSSSVIFYMELSTQVFKTFGRFLGVSFHTALLGCLGVGTVFFASRSIRTYSYYMRYRDISKDIYKIGVALVHTLCKNKLFTTDIEELNVLTFGDKEGYVYCHLDKGTTYEKSLFVQMIQEIVNPIYNPRYIIVRKSKLLNVIQQSDYHAVPEIIAKKSALAKDFLHFWQYYVGDAELVFTKSIRGCTFLIQARMEALSNSLMEKKDIEHVNTWR